MNSGAPRDLKFLLCEYVRTEQGSKLTLLGFFPGGRIRVPADTVTAMLPMALLFIVESRNEVVPKISVTLKSPNGNLVLDKDEQPPVNQGRAATHTVVLQFSPFQTQEFGEYTGTMFYGNEELPFSFGIEKASLNQQP